MKIHEGPWYQSWGYPHVDETGHSSLELWHWGHSGHSGPYQWWPWRDLLRMMMRMRMMNQRKVISKPLQLACQARWHQRTRWWCIKAVKSCTWIRDVSQSSKTSSLCISAPSWWKNRWSRTSLTEPAWGRIGRGTFIGTSKAATGLPDLVLRNLWEEIQMEN